jgi:mutator protein MutT
MRMHVEKLVAMLMVKNKKLLAEVRKTKNDFGSGATWIPGGHVEKGETNEQAFHRELKEEMEIIPQTFFELCTLPWEHKGKKYSITFFVCSKWKGEIQNNEAANLIWINENEIEKLDEEVDREAYRMFLKK